MPIIANKHKNIINGRRRPSLTVQRSLVEISVFRTISGVLKRIPTGNLERRNILTDNDKLTLTLLLELKIFGDLFYLEHRKRANKGTNE